MRLPLLLIIGFTVGCNGAIGDAPDDPLAVHDAPVEPTLGVDVPAYTQPPVQVRLLPFSIRLAKVAAVVDRPTNDMMFSELLRRRYQLGDYDFANGIVGDNQWSASRATNWIASLKPVCASAAMTNRFPDLGGTDLDAFYKAATGRTLTQDELAGFTQDLEGLEGEERNQTTCLAVLASLEFVAQ